MQLSRFIDQLPVEDWAAGVASLTRRLRRRVVRRPGVFALAAVVAGSALLIHQNALWRQSAAHPAPYWGIADSDSVVPVDAPAHSPLVERIQTVLLEKPATGILDETTVARIRAFEAEQGLPVTGAPSLALLTALETEATLPARTVEMSSHARPEERAAPKPVDVEALQRLLNQEGFGPLDVDGLMGPRTRAALSRFAQTPEGRARLSSDALALVFDAS